MTTEPPPAAVIEAFGGDFSALQLLPGGQGGSWRAGAIVLKRSGPHSDAPWLGPILSTLPASPEFRLACPVQAADGRWTMTGWEATSWLAGHHEPGRWTDALVTSRALHTALSDHVLERPSGLARRPNNPWMLGDEAAWGERLAGEVGAVASKLLTSLGRLIEGEWRGSPPQLIHGDLGLGNMLFGDVEGLAPGVIDFSPYWRPAGFALAILVADAVAWQGAPERLATDLERDERHGRQLLARAVVYRLVTGAHLWPIDSERFAAEVDHYRLIVSLLGRLSGD